jgi:hypothetical protein
MSYATAGLAMPHPNELCRILMNYAAPLGAMPHPNELRRSLLSYAAHTVAIIAIITVKSGRCRVKQIPKNLVFSINLLVLWSVVTVALPEYFSVTLSLLNLLEKSLGRSKPATRLMQAHEHTVWRFYYIQALLNCLL